MAGSAPLPVNLGSSPLLNVSGELVLLVASTTVDGSASLPFVQSDPHATAQAKIASA